MINQLTLCNIDLHNQFGSDNSLFFDRVKHLNQMRTRPSDEAFSYFISSEYEWIKLKELHLAVRTGKIEFSDYDMQKRMHVFALDINKRIIDWLYYSNQSELEKQIITWMAILYFLNVDDRKILDKHFYNKLLHKAKKLIQERFTKYFAVSLDKNNIYTPKKSQLLDANDINLKYLEICKDHYKKAPVYPLDNPWGYSIKEDEFGVIGPKIHFNYSFMYDRDWNTIVIDGITDSLNRAESSSGLICEWKEVISNHQINGHHIYNPTTEIILGEYSAYHEGYIYLLSNDSFREGLFKIGFTSKSVEERADKLYTSGVPEPFNIEFKMPVNNIYNVEKAIHNELALFRHNREREFFLGNKDLFIKTIRKFKNFR